jgi:hypothetical protein
MESRGKPGVTSWNPFSSERDAGRSPEILKAPVTFFTNPDSTPPRASAEIRLQIVFLEHDEQAEDDDPEDGDDDPGGNA